MVVDQDGQQAQTTEVQAKAQAEIDRQKVANLALRLSLKTRAYEQHRYDKHLMWAPADRWGSTGAGATSRSS